MARSKKTKSPKKGDNEKKDKKDISKKVVEKKAAKKNTETDKEGHKKRRKKSDYSTYGRFLFKVLKQVHPDIGITVKAMDIMESFVQDMFERIAMTSSRLAQHNKKKTLGSRETLAAIKLVIPGQLGAHAINEGSKALSTFSKSIDTSQ